METYMFYTTHLVMIACIAGIIWAGMAENIKDLARMLLKLPNGVSVIKNLKARYSLLITDSKSIKALIVNILSIGMQISLQLLK